MCFLDWMYRIKKDTCTSIVQFIWWADWLLVPSFNQINCLTIGKVIQSDQEIDYWCRHSIRSADWLFGAVIRSQDWQLVRLLSSQYTQVLHNIRPILLYNRRCTKCPTVICIWRDMSVGIMWWTVRYVIPLPFYHNT